MPDYSLGMNGKGHRRDDMILRAKPGDFVGPDLPEGVLPDGEDWHPMTIQWWDQIRRSPQARVAASEVDWGYLLDTALLHHIYWAKGRWEYAAELRIRLAKFGATPADRRALHVFIDAPEEFSVGTVSDKPYGAAWSDRAREEGYGDDVKRWRQDRWNRVVNADI